MQKSGEIIAEILDDDLQTTDTETSIELNFAILKFKHTIKKKNKWERFALSQAPGLNTVSFTGWWRKFRIDTKAWAEKQEQVCSFRTSVPQIPYDSFPPFGGLFFITFIRKVMKIKNKTSCKIQLILSKNIFLCALVCSIMKIWNNVSPLCPGKIRSQVKKLISIFEGWPLSFRRFDPRPAIMSRKCPLHF